MTRVVPFTKNREVIYGLMNRARRFHSTCSGVHQIDVTHLLNVMETYRLADHRVGIDAVLIRATSLLLRKYPRLNHHLFHGLLRKREIDFEDICCNVIMLRRHRGEFVLFPVLIENSDQLSVQEIDAVLKHHRGAPLADLPQLQGIQKLKKAPLVGLKAFSFLSRSNPKFYRKYFGTYGYSSILVEDKHGVKLEPNGFVSQSAANTCTGFMPCSISEQPVVYKGEVVPRKILSLVMLMDHYLIDGHDALIAIKYLDRLLTKPEKLGLTGPSSQCRKTEPPSRLGD